MPDYPLEALKKATGIGPDRPLTGEVPGSLQGVNPRSLLTMGEWLAKNKKMAPAIAALLKQALTFEASTPDPRAILAASRYGARLPSKPQIQAPEGFTFLGRRQGSLLPGKGLASKQAIAARRLRKVPRDPRFTDPKLAGSQQELAPVARGVEEVSWLTPPAAATTPKALSRMVGPRPRGQPTGTKLPLSKVDDTTKETIQRAVMLDGRSIADVAADYPTLTKETIQKIVKLPPKWTP